MRKIIFIIILCSSVLSVFSYSTEASKYAESKYAEKQGFKKAHIDVKKEHTDEYQQKISEQMIPAITYGYGDMMGKYNDKAWGKKCRVSYIVLFNCDCKPIWSYVMPSRQ